MKFVPAGTTLENKDPDSDPNIAHVDTGLGKFDHHQIRSDKLSATKRVFDHLCRENHIPEKQLTAVTRIVEFVTAIDNFGEVFFDEPTADIYDFSLHQLIEGLKSTAKNDRGVCELMFQMLDATLELFKKKIHAEGEVKKGFVFHTSWGKALAMETRNEEALKYALKCGYKIVVRRDPEKRFIRIKARPEKNIDLTSVYEKVAELDPKATWFFHISKHMLLNGSSKNPNAVASSLSLKKVVEIIQEIK